MRQVLIQNSLLSGSHAGFFGNCSNHLNHRNCDFFSSISIAHFRNFGSKLIKRFVEYFNQTSLRFRFLSNLIFQSRSSPLEKFYHAIIPSFIGHLERCDYRICFKIRAVFGWTNVNVSTITVDQ